jgi:hypothetical protein
MHGRYREAARVSRRAARRTTPSMLGRTVAEMTTNPSTAPPATRSAAAERSRAHRQRRREGLRCVTIEIRDSEIDALVRKQLLKPVMRNDTTAIIDALYAFLDRTLDATA